MGGPGSGRPRTPTSLLRLHGTYREDRHGGRSDHVHDLGQPEAEPGLSGAAAAEYGRLVANAPAGLLGLLDTGLLTIASQAWAAYEAEQTAGNHAEARRWGDLYIKTLGKLALLPPACQNARDPPPKPTSGLPPRKRK